MNVWMLQSPPGFNMRSPGCKPGDLRYSQSTTPQGLNIEICVRVVMKLKVVPTRIFVTIIKYFIFYLCNMLHSTPCGVGLRLVSIPVVSPPATHIKALRASKTNAEINPCSK